jgi:ER membrane protein complex subunit 1
MIPAIRGPVASVGKVLGNRATLYKYLNSRLFVVLTELPSSSVSDSGSNSGSPQTCGIYLVDTTKGSVVYRASVPSSSGSCAVKATLSENWLVYHYYEKDAEATGYRMVSVELYEGEKADDKTKRCEFSLLFFSFC